MQCLPNPSKTFRLTTHSLKKQILSLEEDTKIKEETSLKEIEKMQVQAEQTLEQINLLSNEILNNCSILFILLPGKILINLLLV